ncbi:MAG: ABC transporter ATP-binding protein [Acidimicrobiia bacterium]|nr:ABC transporter ATP-binding protein [Acidimicrobiia bacterium]
MVTDGLELTGLSVSYGEHRVLDDLHLTVDPGEIVVLLGPSGCGKSTLLRTVAGLEIPDTGTVRWAERRVDRLPPHERGFGLMFQHHALFPHRNVADNVAFGLEVRGDSRDGRATRVDELLTLVGLPGYQRRPITALSGGEAQRVALARALAPGPRLLLLDEPLASLDRPLRDRLLLDLRRLRDELDLTIVHVTHDRDEAFALADRLSLLHDGHVTAEGAPEQLWAQPPDSWTAKFLGHRNVVAAERLPGATHSSGELVVPIDAVEIVTSGAVRAVVVSSRFTSRGFEVSLDVDGLELVARSDDGPPAGTLVSVRIDHARVVTLD